jgi:hypothetical protein
MIVASVPLAAAAVASGIAVGSGSAVAVGVGSGVLVGTGVYVGGTIAAVGRSRSSACARVCRLMSGMRRTQTTTLVMSGMVTRVMRTFFTTICTKIYHMAS